MKITGISGTRQVFVDDVELSPKRSQEVFNHSPDGFSWGYAGSGPSQLALALLLLVTEDAHQSVVLHQDLKHDLVEKLPLDKDFEIDYDVKTWFINHSKTGDEKKGE